MGHFPHDVAFGAILSIIIQKFYGIYTKKKKGKGKEVYDDEKNMAERMNWMMFFILTIALTMICQLEEEPFYRSYEGIQGIAIGLRTLYPTQRQANNNNNKNNNNKNNFFLLGCGVLFFPHF